MSDRSTTATLSRLFPTDLVLFSVLGLATAMGGIGRLDSMLGVVGAFAAVLFAPGYALVATLFPTSGVKNDTFDSLTTPANFRRQHITGAERIVLSVSMSVCLVPFLGIALAFTPFDLRLQFLWAIAAMTLTLSIAAAVRRQSVPEQERFNPGVLSAADEIRNRFERTRSESTLSLVVMVGFVIAAAGLGGAVMTAEGGEQFTEFYITTQEPSSSESVAGGYPDEIAVGDSAAVQVGLANHEGVQMDYTIVAILQYGVTGNGSEDIRTESVETFNVTASQGENATIIHSVEPATPGENVRVLYLLYRGALPEQIRYQQESAYRSVHFWVDVPAASEP